MRTRTVSVKRQALLVTRAAEMRADPSLPEQLLWAALTNGKRGVSFRRQVPVAGYICDFVCASRRLVVEVDGALHVRRRGADARRDECLRSMQFHGNSSISICRASCAASSMNRSNSARNSVMGRAGPPSADITFDKS